MSDERTSDPRRVRDLRDQLRTSPQALIIWELKHLHVGAEIFDGNMRDLRRLLQAAEDPMTAVQLWSAFDRERLRRFQVEVIRLIHNLVASSYSFVEHVDHLVKNHYAKDGRFPDYDAEFERLVTTNAVFQFMWGLRNYAQHHRLPVVNSRMQIMGTAGGLVHRQSLPTEKLLRFNTWSKPARKYIKRSAPSIDLIGALDQFEVAFKAYAAWVFERLTSIHSGDLAYLHDLEEQLRTEQAPELPTRLRSELKYVRERRISTETAVRPFLSDKTWAHIINAFPDREARAQEFLVHLRKYSAIEDDLANEVLAAFREHSNPSEPTDLNPAADSEE